MALATVLMWLGAGAVVSLLLTQRAAAQREGATSWGPRLLRLPLHLLLWPLFVPLLLPQEARAEEGALGPGEWDGSICRAEEGLRQALDGLSRQVEDPLSLERARVAALGRALRGAAARVAELDRVLSTPDFDPSALREELASRRTADDAQPVVDVLERRLAHVERLAHLQRQARVDLERALGEAAALASRLTLLRYEGPAGAATAAGSARELTQTVEELCRVLTEARAA